MFNLNAQALRHEQIRAVGSASPLRCAVIAGGAVFFLKRYRCKVQGLRWLSAIVLSAVLACVNGVSAAEPEGGVYAWHNVAIRGGGFVTGVEFHPLERGLGYARTDVGGAYRWDGAQRRWLPLTDWIGHADVNLLGIESLALDPSDPNQLYLAAGTYLKQGNGVILRSSDRGATFKRVELPFPMGGNELGRGNGERLVVDPNDGRILLFGSRDAGLWRSSDAGASWTRVKSFPAVATAPEAGVQTSWAGLQPVGISALMFDKASGQAGNPTPTVYAAVATAQAGVFVSHDGGSHWQPVAAQPQGLRVTRIARASDGTLYLSYADDPGPNTMNNGALWRFHPATGQWHDISPVPQSSDQHGDGFGWGAVAVDPSNPRVLLASTFCRYGPHDEIYRSVDAGEHWTPLLAGAEFDHRNAPWTRDTAPHWIASLAIDPFDTDHAMFVTGYGIWASRNLSRAGSEPLRWSFDDAGLEETVPLALLSPAQGAALISGVGDIDGFRHDDLERPQLQFDGPRLTNTEALADAGQAPGWLLRAGRIRHYQDQVRALYSSDGGAHWQPLTREPPEGEGAGRIALGADAKRLIWIPEKSTRAWLSDNLGGRWQAVQGLPATATVVADRFDAGLYYAFDAITGKLYISGNGGVSFKPTGGGSGAIGDWYRAEMHASTTQSATVYITASWRGLLRWSAKGLERLPGVENAYSLGLGAPKRAGGAPTLYVYGQIAGIIGLYRSDDDGKHWLRIDDDAHRYGRISRITGDPKRYGRVYFATEGRGIIYGDPR